MKLVTALENLKFFAYHGLYEFEKKQGADFFVDVFIEEDINISNNLQALDEIINYEDIFAIVSEEMTKSRSYIEDVAKRILQRISHYLIVRKVKITVKITKPNPGGKFGSGAASVSLSI